VRRLIESLCVGPTQSAIKYWVLYRGPVAFLAIATGIF
jgi:hypothetical protein